MVHFKLHNGFSFIEVVLSLAVMSIVLVSIFALQQAVMNSCFSATNKARRILLLKNILYDPTIVRENYDEKITPEKKIKEPPTVIKISKEKTEHKQLKKYVLEKLLVKAMWDDFWGRQDESLFLIRFVPPKKEERS